MSPRRVIYLGAPPPAAPSPPPAVPPALDLESKNMTRTSSKKRWPCLCRSSALYRRPLATDWITVASDLVCRHGPRLLAALCHVLLDECGSAFAEEAKLKRHEKSVHLKIRDHVCDDCGSSFSEKGHLKTHIKNLHGSRDDSGYCVNTGKPGRLIA